VIAHAIYIDDEGCELAKQRNVVVVPTLSVVEHILRYGEKNWNTSLGCFGIHIYLYCSYLLMSETF